MLLCTIASISKIVLHTELALLKSFKKSFQMRRLLYYTATISPQCIGTVLHSIQFLLFLKQFWHPTFIYTHTRAIAMETSSQKPAPLLIMLPWPPSQNSPFLARPSLVLVSHNLQGKPQFNASDIQHSSFFPLL